MDSNELAIGPVTERMDPVPAVAPTPGELSTQNQQDQPRRGPSPGEQAPDDAVADRTLDPANGSDADSDSDVDNEGPTHRVDSLA